MLKTKIHTRELDTCIYNASGVFCSTENELNLLCNTNTSVGAVLSKSCTLQLRSGNLKPRYWDCNKLSINSSGLPNLGYDFYNTYSYKYKFNTYNKPYILSLAGLTKEDNIYMINNLNQNLVDGIELNMSCPNIKGKSQTGYDFESTEELLRKASEIIDSKHSKDFIFGVKLPPYFDELHFNTVSEIINNSSVNAITCINSLGNGLVVDIDTESTVIKPKNGFGGIGGSVVKPIALSNVHKFYTLTNCSVIGCGGISTGQDAFEHILCGASAVQIGTQFYKEKHSCFRRIETELKQIMKEKRYTSLDDFKGKLSYLT